MPEAVIVATARSPIGRAFKGSLTTIRPDDAVRQMVVAALAKVPQLDPGDIADPYASAAASAASIGTNAARVVATAGRATTSPAAGHHGHPVTARPRCRPPGQAGSAAIKAGEGRRSVGWRRMREPVRPGSSGQPAGHGRTRKFAAAVRAPRARSGRGAHFGLAGPAQRRRGAGRASPWGRRRGERGPRSAASPGGAQDEFGVRSAEPRRRRHRPTGSGSRTSPRSPSRTAPWSPPDDGAPATAPRRRSVAGLQPVFRPDGTVTAGVPLPAQRRRRGGSAPASDPRRRPTSERHRWRGIVATG